MNLKEAQRHAFIKYDGNVLPMAKPVLFFFCFFLMTVLAHAQQQKPHEPVRLDPAKDKLAYRELTIRLLPTIEGYSGHVPIMIPLSRLSQPKRFSSSNTIKP